MTQNTSKIEKLSDDRYLITLEEDSETGDVLLPLPQELLDIKGWKEGDTLKWIINNDGTASITRDAESQSGS